MKMWCWRRMLRISWAKNLKNDKALDLAEERRVLIATIMKKQLVFFGHIIRQNSLERLRAKRQEKDNLSPTWQA